MIKGFKCFNSGLINRYGMKYELQKEYRAAEVSFGVHSIGGFHFCTRMEDTFRYYDAFNSHVDICEVTASGTIIKGPDDDYNGYYDSYVADTLVLNKLLTYDEIIAYAASLDDLRFKRFVSLYRIHEQELEYFKRKYSQYPGVLDTINYYYKQR